jgi:ferritin-like protein
MLRHWGVTKLDGYEYSESIDEMKHADKLIERILFLGGLPNVQELDKLYRLPVMPRCGRGDRQAYHVWGMDDGSILFS